MRNRIVRTLIVVVISTSMGSYSHTAFAQTTGSVLGDIAVEKMERETEKVIREAREKRAARETRERERDRVIREIDNSSGGIKTDTEPSCPPKYC